MARSQPICRSSKSRKSSRSLISKPLNRLASPGLAAQPRRRGGRMRRRMSADVMFDTIDRIVNLDLGKRGVDKLYAPARPRSGEALAAAAARSIAKLAAADRVA